MTATEAVEVLERHGVKVALSGNGLGFVKQCAEVIIKLETALHGLADQQAMPDDSWKKALGDPRGCPRFVPREGLGWKLCDNCGIHEDKHA